MHKMERTNHGKGSALAMGLDNMHVCVLLGFDKDYMLESMVLMCVLC
jgi:hypothetical protein